MAGADMSEAAKKRGAVAICAHVPLSLDFPVLLGVTESSARESGAFRDGTAGTEILTCAKTGGR